MFDRLELNPHLHLSQNLSRLGDVAQHHCSPLVDAAFDVAAESGCFELLLLALERGHGLCEFRPPGLRSLQRAGELWDVTPAADGVDVPRHLRLDAPKFPFHLLQSFYGIRALRRGDCPGDDFLQHIHTQDLLRDLVEHDGVGLSHRHLKPIGADARPAPVIRVTRVEGNTAAAVGVRPHMHHPVAARTATEAWKEIL